jgi:hypothetical protein
MVMLNKIIGDLTNIITTKCEGYLMILSSNHIGC